MKLGYACINWGVCRPRTFRLNSFTEQRFHEAVKANLDCLKNTLHWNIEHGFYFFRISSDLIPFASHPINKIKWAEDYKNNLVQIGNLIKKNDIRISMHPDQFVVLNSNRQDVVEKSLLDLKWHAKLLDSMGLDKSAKIQIHVGGVYGNKTDAIKRFIENYKVLPKEIKNRLAIENDEISYSLKDCLQIHHQTKIPIIFDVFHHKILNNKEHVLESLKAASQTWKKEDGIIMIDFSTGATRKHDETLNDDKFREFMANVKKQKLDIDIMLEIKDKEASAIRALDIMNEQ
jgi:UV DNA damage endonuclease